MHVIRHQAGRDQPHAAQIALQHILVFAVVGIIGKERQTGPCPLHDVMRNIRYDDAGEPGHDDHEGEK